MNIRKEMPILAKHEGEWKGVYTVVDPDGKIMDQHESYLTNYFQDDEQYPYYQTNTYTWKDGTKQVIEFPGSYKDKKIHFDTERINGYTWEVDDQTLLLTWEYIEDPSISLYEMINLSKCANHRTRVWHWLKDGELVKRTLIKEERVV